MLEVNSRPSPSAEGSPLSFRNAPQAVKMTQIIGASMTGYGLPAPMPTPAFEQLYDPAQAKCLPSKGPAGKGKFVDWGTKLYELELELCYKNNEIDVLQKNLKKLTDELYPEGNTSKGSIISSLRTRNDATQRILQKRERELKKEKNRCRGLESDLVRVKKENKELRKCQSVREKAVQTKPINNEILQISTPSSKNLLTRSVMTQCSPSVLKAAYSTKPTPRPDMAETRSFGDVHQRPQYRTVETRQSSPQNGSERHFSSQNASERQSSSQNAFDRHFSPQNASERQFSPQNASLASWFSSASGSLITRSRGKMNARADTELFHGDNETKEDMAPQELSAETNKYPEETALVRSDGYSASKLGVKFATSMTIKDGTDHATRVRDPFEMSITQEFDKENSVKTIVQSNRDFEIRQKPVLHTRDGLTIAGVEHVSRPEHLNPTASRSADVDSGLGSNAGSDKDSTFSCKATDPALASLQRTGKLSYKQILDGATLSTQEKRPTTPGRVFERTFHELTQSGSHARSPRLQSRPISADRDPRFNTTAWEIYNRGYAKTNPSGMVPYYLFKRSNESASKNRPSTEKPIFVHVSEISMHH